MTPDPLAPFCERHGLTLEQEQSLRALVRDVVLMETTDGGSLMRPQPIETAPRDGTDVLAYYPSKTRSPSGWYRAYFDPDSQRWYRVPGTYSTQIQPSHWMGLPDPPETT